MSSSPDEEPLQLADVVDDEFPPSGRESAESMEEAVDLDDLELVDEIGEDVNGIEDEELDDEDDGLEEDDLDASGDFQDEEEPREEEYDELQMAEGLLAEEGDSMDSLHLRESDEKEGEIEGEDFEGEEDEGDVQDEEEEEDLEEDDGEDDDEQNLSPSKSKLVGTPGRLRRSGEHQAAEDSKSVACRLPTNLEIREGHDFQVFVPDFEEQAEEVHETEKEKCLWKPMKDGDAEEIDDFCSFCEARFGMQRDRSLFILRLANYDFEKAKQKCEVRTIINDEWSEEDKWLFKHCLTNFGKNFSKIRNVMPHKSVDALVQHYYNTKKNQHYKSFFDVDHILMNEESSEENVDDEDETAKGVRIENRAVTPEVAEDAEEDSQDANTDSDDEVICSNCQEYVNKIHDVDDLRLCTTCFYYLKATNMMRPSRELTSRKKIKLPDDMTGIVAEFHRSAMKIEEPIYDIEGDEDDEVRVYSKCTYAVDEDLLAVYKEIQEVRTRLLRMDKNVVEDQFDFRNADNEVDQFRKMVDCRGESSQSQSPEPNDEWTDREMTIAFHALVLYDKDYARTSKLIRTKDVDQVREFAERYTEQVDEILASTSNLEEEESASERSEPSDVEEDSEETPPVWSIAEEALENWWSEVERLEAEKGAKELRYTEAMRPVGHFTQPARGDLREIGCGYAIYGKQHFFFCNFDKGNTPNSTVLNFGSSCVRDSDCAWYTGFSCIRDTGLCTVNSPPDRVAFLLTRFILRLANYDFEKAKQKCEVRTIINDEWSEEDKNVDVDDEDETAKGVRIENRAVTPEVAEDAEEDSQDANTDSDDEVICSNCQEYVNKIHDVDDLRLCTTCFYYLKATNMMRPSRELTSRKKIKLPDDMTGIVAEFHRSAMKIEEPIYDIEGDEDDEVRVYSKCTYAVDEDLLAVYKEIQEVRTRLLRMDKNVVEDQFDFRNADNEVDQFRKMVDCRGESSQSQSPEPNDEWTDREMTIAFHALVLYDKDYARTSKLIRTKDVDQVREFAERYTEQVDEILASTSNLEEEESASERSEPSDVEEDSEESEDGSSSSSSQRLSSENDTEMVDEPPGDDSVNAEFSAVHADDDVIAV
ncbi:hypothetical protein QR680_005453 [Steinernema hermaphroditum]|uniref:Myb-like domain-containing protein n=1 Tax=Steinernema hermaphroditum TaxID=289476 RepID=A0AA39HS39_9BILA|nr:hypothetical protein QR680_005453 [Steinernema hermaphroditum]